ncbi:hypothetical protein Bca4012_017494 [Brassica carinata]
MVKKPRRWFPPRQDWLMRNVVFEWLKKSRLLVVAWVVRNHRVVVLVHSRRAFSDIGSLDDVRLTTILSTVDSMISLRYNKMVFVSDFKNISAVVLKLLHWPVMRYYTEELNTRLA